MKKNILAILTVLVLVLLVSCNSNNSSEPSTKSANTEIHKVKLGIVGSDLRIWGEVAKRLKEKNIEIEFVQFTDYNTPNDALLNKDIDLNAFQHRIFLNNYNETKGSDLTPIGNTINAPLGIYSQKIKSLDEIKDGSIIAIPNDSTNGGRSLILLQTAGFIKLKKEAGLKPTPKDIEKYNIAIKIEELDASQTARVLPDVTASIINSGMARDAGFTPTTDSIYLEKVDENSEPYINIIAARSEDVENEIYKKIVAEYQSEETKKLIEDTYKGGLIPAW